MATGRSDFPSQVNNSLVFPGMFRGALDVRARTITYEMEQAAAQVRWGDAFDFRVPPAVAAAVAKSAMEGDLGRG